LVLEGVHGRVRAFIVGPKFQLARRRQTILERHERC
jgi:hypothetical protein